MHVAVAGWLLPLGPSGAQRRLLSLLRAVGSLLAHDERVTLLGSPKDVPPLRGIGVHSVDLPAQPTWRRVLAERRRLAQTLREVEATVLDLASLPVPSGLPCPVCLTIHDIRDLGAMRRRSRRLSRFVLRQSIGRAARIVVPSRFTAHSLASELGEMAAEVVVVPGGVDEGFLSVKRAPRDPPLFLHVGHLEERKNLAMLLRAFSGLRVRAATLTLAGPDHGAGRELRALARSLSVEERVHFAGPVDESRLRQLYGSASAVVLPSLHEGFGLPALEGLAAGAPTLVSDQGALPEVVGDAGIVLPAGDHAAWTEALEQCATSPRDDEQEREARRARARVFSWQEAARAWLDAWRAMARHA